MWRSIGAIHRIYKMAFSSQGDGLSTSHIIKDGLTATPHLSRGVGVSLAGADLRYKVDLFNIIQYCKKNLSNLMCFNGEMNKGKYTNEKLTKI